MRRYLAHHIIYRGADHAMSVAEIADDGTLVSIKPYVRETEATIFVTGNLVIRDRIDGKVELEGGDDNKICTK